MELNLAVLLVEPAAFAAGVGIQRIPARALQTRRTPLLAVLAVASAVAAATSGGSPTGWVVLDLLLLAGLGAAAVFAGARAPSLSILAAGLVCTAAGTESIALPLALAAVGLALASLLVEPDALVDAGAGALVAQAALRLTSPAGEGLTALVATGVFVLLLGMAAGTLERRDRRRVLQVGLAVGALSVVGGIAGGVAAASAVGPLRRGLDRATLTLDATSAVELEATATGLADAGRDFSEARSALEAWWALPARAVPVVAQHWRALHAAALTGDQLAEAGQRALSAPALGDVRLVDGGIPLDQLAAVEPAVADVAARASAARRRLDAARSAWLVPPLADKLDTHLVRMREIERTTELAHRILPMVPRLFGGEGTRRYFLAVQTPAEARGGGGFLGNFGEITAEGGRLRLSRFGRPDELTEAPGRAGRTLEAPDDFLARYARFQPDQTWANINLSPDVPTNARVIANMYPQSGGVPIDGVITVDPAGLAALLAVVGPVEVASWPTPINSANAVQTLLYDQYQRFGNPDVLERIDFLGEVAQVAWGRLTGADLPPLPQILATMGPAVRQKHIFFSSVHPEEQRLFEDLGAAGRMAPVAGDFVGLVTQNASGNKIDYFLRRQLDYRVQLDPGSGRLVATARVALHNEAPASGLNSVLIGNEVLPPLPNGSNKLYFSFYTPWDLAGATIDGVPVELERATELGRQVYSTAVVIPPKSTATLELSLSGRLEDADAYRLDLHRQPMVAPDPVTTTLAVVPGWETPGGTREQTSTHQLESDATVEIPLRRP